MVEDAQMKRKVNCFFKARVANDEKEPVVRNVCPFNRNLER
jgi:hypothetical protein